MFKNAMKYGGIILGKLEDEIKRRRTFAIISHPDAGKTTLTEKFLLRQVLLKVKRTPAMLFQTGWK